jgi:hypothetical protein
MPQASSASLRRPETPRFQHSPPASQDQVQDIELQAISQQCRGKSHLVDRRTADARNLWNALPGCYWYHVIEDGLNKNQAL